MKTFLWNSFLILVILTAGIFVGSAFAPKQILQEQDIVALVDVKTSLNLDEDINYTTLSQSQDTQAVYLAFLRQKYQTVKLSYEYQLQNIARNPQDKKDFLKAQKAYFSLVNYIEQNYPPEPKEKQVIEENTPQEEITNTESSK